MAMQINDAISQISEIHDHLTRSEVYRGYRSVPMGLSGGMAFGGAILQESVLRSTTLDGAGGVTIYYLHYVVFWLTIAALSAIMAGSGIVVRYLREPTHARRQARKVIGQFLPCLAAGTLVTYPVVHLNPQWVPLLPGFWATLFGLGIFASRPYLPRAIGWVGLFYLSAGAILLWLAGDASSLSPWAMGWTFGVGQFAAALVLYWKIERKDA